MKQLIKKIKYRFNFRYVFMMYLSQYRIIKVQSIETGLDTIVINKLLENIDDEMEKCFEFGTKFQFHKISNLKLNVCSLLYKQRG